MYRKPSNKKRKIAILGAISAILLIVLVAGKLGSGGSNAATPDEGQVIAQSEIPANTTMMQYFEWNIPDDGSFWNTVAEQADELAEAGYTAVWLPPAYKAVSNKDAGYAPYDLYDLGEFDQKGSLRTKYGTKEEYLRAIEALHKNNIQVYADIVLNHKAGADATETVSAVKIDYSNRNFSQSNPFDIKAATVFNFEGRGTAYSSFKWDATCFDGIDYDSNTKTTAIYKFTNKSWDWEVDTENVNYDYVMHADIDFSNERVVSELKSWGVWYVNFANLDGFRLDSVNNIKYEFYRDWLSHLRSMTAKPLFSVGDFWSGDVNKLTQYIENTDKTTSLFDVPLHNNFFAASSNGGDYDMSKLFEGTLSQVQPQYAVSFVDSHDTQSGQPLQSAVQEWFKPMAYTYILTRKGAYPCVFYGDYYGLVTGEKSFKTEIDILMDVRAKYAYGEQKDYFDDANIVGWTRNGSDAYTDSGLAALITDANGGSKTMNVGSKNAGETWYDITGNITERVKIDADGNGTFLVADKSYSVWVRDAGVEPERPTPEEPTTEEPTTEEPTTENPSVEKPTPEEPTTEEPTTEEPTTEEPTTKPPVNNKVTIYYQNNWKNTYIHYSVAGGSWTAVPGVKMTDVSANFAKIELSLGTADSLTACFNDGSNMWDSNNSANYIFKPGTYTIRGGVMSEGEPANSEYKDTSNTVTVYYKNENDWANVYAHYSLGGTDSMWTAPPGNRMERVGDGYYKIEIDIGSVDKLVICFNDGGSSWDSNGNSNYTIAVSSASNTFTVENGSIVKGEPTK